MCDTIKIIKLFQYPPIAFTAYSMYRDEKRQRKNKISNFLLSAGSQVAENEFQFEFYRYAGECEWNKKRPVSFYAFAFVYVCERTRS